MKFYNDKNVYDAAVERFEYIFNEFDKVCISFSNGKDSGVLLNLAIDVAKRLDKLPVHALYIDLEAQYKHAIDYTVRMFDRPEVKPYWVCLPIHLRNAVSQYQPHWMCWDPDKNEAWVRELPEHFSVISDESYFPFFKRGMEFEEFVPAFGKWFAEGQKTCTVVGIRSDESLNRFRTIKSETKITYRDKAWTTKLFREEESTEIYNAYPIYDWRVEDVWIANGKFGWDYNRIYDLMHMAGISLHKQRLCQPYGDDQRQSLFLFKSLEPQTWAKVVNRVEGANFGNRYTENDRTTLGNYKVNLPPGHTYESYAKFLLDTMPPYLRDHYQIKIDKFISWWEKEGVKEMPDYDDPKLEASRKVPSWRRVCKVLLKNDYWCKGLSFSQTKNEMERQINMVNKYMDIL
jgi:predicted phosphoadenosine phosphosulfate sulfurtransferase